ncbi:MAG: adenylyl-sulfate kinase, partial [Verrucomicrobia bacterium]|nr:adenylyl-sulfate kinase [Verrucomicrobiota bacterium]
MEYKPKNIVWHDPETRAIDRQALMKQRGSVLWLTGLSGSGKSTIAHALEIRLTEQGHVAYVLDGDNIRHRLNGDLGFSEADRNENIRRIAEVARLFADCGVICVPAFIAPFRQAREEARRIIGPENFLEVFVSASLETCERRDPKGLYRKARAGEVPAFTGVSSPYEEPENPDITLDTGEKSVDECVCELLQLLRDRNFIKPY